MGAIVGEKHASTAVWAGASCVVTGRVRQVAVAAERHLRTHGDRDGGADRCSSDRYCDRYRYRYGYGDYHTDPDANTHAYINPDTDGDPYAHSKGVARSSFG